MWSFRALEFCAQVGHVLVGQRLSLQEAGNTMHLSSQPVGVGVVPRWGPAEGYKEKTGILVTGFRSHIEGCKGNPPSFSSRGRNILVRRVGTHSSHVCTGWR